MKTRAVAFFGLLCLVSVFGQSGAVPFSEERSAILRTRWKSGESWLPRRMTTRSEELGKKGEVTSWEASEFSLTYPGAADEPVAGLVRAVKDGKDVTAERLKKPADRQGRPNQEGNDSFPGAVPFQDSVRGKIRWGNAVGGAAGTEIDYTIDAEKRKVRGVLILNAAGEPVSIRYGYDPLPNFVSAFEGEGRFGVLEDGSIVMDSVFFKAEGGILAIKKRFAVRLEFSDYRKD